MSFLSCTPNEATNSGTGNSPATAHHRLQASGETAEGLLRQGGKLVADYGSYQLIDVEPAAYEALAPTAPVELRDDYNQILLNAGAIDTSTAHAASLRAAKPVSGAAQLHMIQFAGPIRPEWYAQLEATGVRVVTYIPNNAYLVYGNGETVERLQTMGKTAAHVQWDGPYLNDYKIDPSVNRIQTGMYQIQLVEDAAANAETLSVIGQFERQATKKSNELGYTNLIVYVTRSAIDRIVQQPDVVSIHPYVVPVKRDERQNMIISGNLTGTQPSGPGWLPWLASKGFTQAQFTASGFGVDLTDSGVDNGTTLPNNFGLYLSGDVLGTSRVVYNRLEGTPHAGSTLQGCDGHGNENSHIIGGYANLTGVPFQDAAGFRYGLGVNPFVKIGSSVIFDPDTFTTPDYEDLQSRAWAAGMRISSNSWGSSANTYTVDSQRYDALVRDAAPTASALPIAGNQEMLIVFAAGNNGTGANTVGSPSTGKNVFTIGASENVQAFGGADLCGTTDDEANSAMDIVGFSSRGPTSDGRKKPDIMAPGSHVSGGVAQSAGQRANPPAIATGDANSCFDASGVCGGPGVDFFPAAGQEWYTASSGTSHSTPAVSGAAGLLRQLFINRGQPVPSPALTKAIFMNNARYMTGTFANDSLYSNNQGMGLMDMGAAFDDLPRLIDDETAASLFTATGQTRAFSGVISDSSKPFRVTLAWTDAPGATSGAASKNNIDLSVTIGANTYKGNVFTGASSVTGGTADTVNNVESVFLPAGVSGPYTVTVTATNINSDGVPGNASALDQDFALVVYNQCATATATPAGVIATASANNRITVAWTENASSAYRIFRSTTAGGPYTQIAEVTSSPYNDNTVSGGSTYFYVVRAKNCAESANSAEASATATGACTLSPTFAGLSTVNNGATSTCTNTLAWTAGAPACAGTLSYNVYRSTSAAFTPAIGNRIATGVTGTGYSDTLNLVNGTRYYYVVRAVETAAATVEETNTVVKSNAPTGAISAGLRYADDLDGSRPPNAAAYWIETTVAGTEQLGLSTCHWHSTTNSYKFGGTACPGTYLASSDNRLVLGGNGSVAGINGFVVPNGSIGSSFSFRHYYNYNDLFGGSWFDGAWLEYSTVGATGPWTYVPDTAVAGQPFITAGGYEDTLTGGRPKAWTRLLTPANGAFGAVTVNLDALAGKTVWLAFRMSTDSSVQNEGQYIDNVAVSIDSAAVCSTSVPPPGPAVSYRVTGLPVSTGAGVNAPFTITAYDAVDQVATGYTGTASFTSTDAAAVLPGNANFTAGVANATIQFRTLGAQSVTATSTVNPSIKGTGSTTVTAGPATKLSIVTQPSNTVAGASITPGVQVSILDQFNNLVSSSTANVTIALGANPGASTLSGTTTVAAVGGVATFSNLSLNKVATGYTLAVSSAGLTGATTTAFNITAAAANKLAMVQQPSNVAAGFSITPAVTVAIQDAFGNATTSTANVTLALAANPGSSTLSGTTTVAAVGGVATFSNLSLNKVATGYTLGATSAGLTGVTSASFNVTPGTDNRVVVLTQPSDIAAGASISPAITVEVQDAFGNRATGSTKTVSLSFANNPSGATLLGTTAVPAVAGVSTFSNISVNRPGLNYTLNVGASGITGTTTVGFDVTAGPANKLVVGVQPSNATAGAAIAPAVTVRILDQFDNPTTSTTTVSVAIGTNPGSGTLSGTTTVAAVAGTATFSNLSINRSGTGYTLNASAAGLTGVTTSAFNIAPGAAAAIEYVTQPSNTAAGAAITPAVSLRVRDALGNTVTGSSANVTVAIGNNPGSGTLSGTTSVAASSGVATFSNLSINKSGAGYTLAASSAGLTGATSSAFNISAGAAASLAIITQPSNTTAGAAISPAVSVAIIDAFGNNTGSTANVTVAIGNNAGGGTLSGATSVAAVGGVATFSGLSIDKVGSGYTLDLSSAGVTGATTSAFDITAGAAAVLAFTGQPSNTNTDSVIAPAVAVTVQDALGNTVTGFSGNISLAIGNNPGSATLGGTTSVAASGGVASFSDLAITVPGVGYTLTASAGALSGTSSAFDVAAGAPASAVFSTQPSNTVAGVAIAPAVQVTVVDAHGNVVTGASGNVVVAFGNNPGGATLNGTLSVALSGGSASFGDLASNTAGTGYTLTADTLGLAQVTSSGFDITAGPAAALAFTVQPTDTVSAATITPAVAVEIRDQFGNRTGDATQIDLALDNASGATLGGTTSVAASAGSATFGDLAIAKTGTGYTLTASASGLTSATSNAFAITAGAAASLSFRVQPSTSAAGAAITPAIEVTLLDAQGNVSASTADVTIALGNNPSGATLSGTATVAAVNGVATFADLSLEKVGTGYTLTASSAGLTDVTSSAFDITAAVPARLVFSTQPTNTVSGAAITPAVVVTVQDTLGNTVSSSAAEITLTLGNAAGATLAGTATATAVNGVATFSDLSIAKAGTGYTLAAASTGLAGATSSAFNVTAGPAVKYVIAGLGASTTAFVEQTLTITAKDASDNTVTGYTGTAGFTTTDTAITAPANKTFVAGVASNVKVTFKTPGTRAITAKDTVTATLTGTATTNVTSVPQPTVSVTEPSDGSTVSGTLTIKATGAVNSATTLQKIELLVDGTVVGSGTSSPATATWDTTTAERNSTHQITAKIYDNAGNTVTSSAVNVTVDNGEPQGCGCGATGGAGGAGLLGLALMARQLLLGSSKRRRQAAAK